MQRTTRALVALTVLGVLAAGCGDVDLNARALPLPPQPSPDPSAVLAAAGPGPVILGEIADGVVAAQVAAYVATLPPILPPPDPPVASPGPLSGSDSGRLVAGPSDGFPSQAWWDAIATCESGNTNAWRTGFFGIEAGYPIGGLSYDDQLAWARRIFAQSGPGAWGCWATVGGPF